MQPHFPVIVITHASFDERRRAALQRLTAQLRLEAPTIPWLIASDGERKGSLWCWRRAMEMGLAHEGSHVVWLPDDAILCRDFGRILTAAIAARPDDVFDCYVNHAEGEHVPGMWYSTPDGYTGMGGVMPRRLLVEHLVWRDEMALPDTFANDAGVNMWAMATRRRIYKTAFTLVQHDVGVPSLDGNDLHDYRQGACWADDSRTGIVDDLGNFLGRTYLAPEAHAPGVARSCTELGRTYQGNHWALMRDIAPEHWDVEAMYEAHRGGPVSPTPMVHMIVPSYREGYDIVKLTEPSRQAICQDLADHGIGVMRSNIDGDSLVQRMRQRGVHTFLKSAATHLLWCDLDIEALDPTCVRKMLATGFDVIAGACPFKSTERRVVCNLWPGTLEAMQEAGKLDAPAACLEVQDAGTGFMLVSRKAIVTLMQAHPELLHWSQSSSDHGEPLWALYDTGVVRGVYQSEDYMFCHLWQEAGGKVYVHLPSAFRHYGTHGFEASIMEQLGLARA